MINNIEVNNINNINNYRKKKIIFILVCYLVISIILLIIFFNEIKKNIYLSLAIYFGIPFIFLILNHLYDRIYRIRNLYILNNILENGLLQSNELTYNMFNITTNETSQFNIEEIKNKLMTIHKLETNNEICNICMTNKNEIKLNCSNNGYHGGCLICIAEWTKNKNCCHECREKIINIV